MDQLNKRQLVSERPNEKTGIEITTRYRVRTEGGIRAAKVKIRGDSAVGL